MSLVLRSWQRPGAVTNCTLDEYDHIQKVDDVHVLRVKEHKTSVCGSAKLFLDKIMMRRLKAYIRHIRPKLARAGRDVNYLFILPGSVKIEKYGNVVKLLENRLKLKIPTPTMVRKIRSTAVVKTMKEPQARVIMRQLSDVQYNQ